MGGGSLHQSSMEAKIRPMEYLFKAEQMIICIGSFVLGLKNICLYLVVNSSFKDFNSKS